VAAPQYQSKSTTSEGYTTTFTPSVPSGTAEGDLLVAVCFGAASWNTPSGWTSQLSASSSAYISVFTKTAGASESATTFELSIESYGYVVVYRITGADTSSPIDASGSATSSLDSPGVTTTQADTLVLHLFASLSTSGTALVQPSGDTALDLPSNFYAGAASSYKTQASAGSTGAATWDDSSVTSDQVTATIAIAPAAAVYSGPTVASSTTCGTVVGPTSAAPTIPPGTYPGDTLLCVTWRTGGAFVAPSGWTAIPTANDLNASTYMRAFYRVYQSGDSMPTFASGSGTYRASLYRITNADGIDIANISSGLSAPSVSASSNALVFHILGNSGGTSVTVPTGDTVGEESASTNLTASVGYHTQAASGATGSATFSYSGSNSDHDAATIVFATAGGDQRHWLNNGLIHHWRNGQTDDVADADLSPFGASSAIVGTLSGAPLDGNRGLLSGSLAYPHGWRSADVNLYGEITVSVWVFCGDSRDAITLTGPSDDIRVYKSGFDWKVDKNASPILTLTTSTQGSVWELVTLRITDGDTELRVASSTGGDTGWESAGATVSGEWTQIDLATATGVSPTSIDDAAVWNRALSDDEVATLYNSGDGQSYVEGGYHVLPAVYSEATPYSADPGPLLTDAPSVDAEFDLQQVLPGTFYTTVEQIDAEAELRQIPLADFITQLDTIDAESTVYTALPGIFTTSLAAIDAEFDLQQIPNAPYVTVLGVIDSEGAVEIAVPGVLTTSPPVIEAEGEIPDVLDPVIYTTLDVIDCEGDVQSMVAGVLTTSLDTVDAEIDLQAIVLPPYITTVDVIDAECDIYAAVPGILTTTVGTVEAEAYIFSPFMQALSDVYRVYIANQALTANVGTSSQFILNERTTSPYTGQLVDEGGDSITKSVLDACQLVVYDKRTRTIIRETRDAFDTIATNGAVSWEITPLETSIVSTTIPMGQNEPRIATFEFAWDSEDYDDYSLTFASTVDTKAVTVTHAMHGLAVEDYVVFKDAPAVGGLEMDGVFVVGSVADANTYTVTHVKAATSTASSSGTVTVYRRPQVSKHQFEFQVKKAEVE
jgi:hypothetical protein